MVLDLQHWSDSVRLTLSDGYSLYRHVHAREQCWGKGGGNLRPRRRLGGLKPRLFNDGHLVCGYACRIEVDLASADWRALSPPSDNKRSVAPGRMASYRDL